jgi:hypothetical protein
MIDKLSTVANKPIIFFGAGEYARLSIERWRRLSFEPPYFCDSDERKWHTRFCGYEMLPLSLAMERNPCRILDDSIQFSRWPLFFAREVLQGVVDSLKARKGGGDGTSIA